METIEGLTQEQTKSALEYIAQVLNENFDKYEVNKTLSTIDHYRCSLSNANYAMHQLIQDTFDDWCCDNDLESENYYIDTDSIFFEL